MKFKVGDRVVAQITKTGSEKGTIASVDTADHDLTYQVQYDGGVVTGWYSEDELTLIIKLSDEAERVFGDIINEI